MTDAEPHDQRDWRRIALYLVALGGMSVSISGQVQSIEAQLGTFLAVVFAVTNDVGAILALDIALSAANSAIKGWAWVAILIAAGTGGALNTHHAAAMPAAAIGVNPASPPLPTEFAILVGLEPVILVLVLSHLIGLVVAARNGPAVAGHPPRVAGSQPVVAKVGDRQETAIVARKSAAGDRQPVPVPGGQPVHVPGGQSTDRRPADRRPADRRVPAAVGQPSPPATHRPDRSPSPDAGRPARALAAVPEPRPAWMTDDLIAAVVKARRQDSSYGRGQVIADHKIGSGKAREVLSYIKRHGLMRESA